MPDECFLVWPIVAQLGIFRHRTQTATHIRNQISLFLSNVIVNLERTLRTTPQQKDQHGAR